MLDALDLRLYSELYLKGLIREGKNSIFKMSSIIKHYAIIFLSLIDS